MKMKVTTGKHMLRLPREHGFQPLRGLAIAATGRAEIAWGQRLRSSTAKGRRKPARNKDLWAVSTRFLGRFASFSSSFTAIRGDLGRISCHFRRAEP